MAFAGLLLLIASVARMVGSSYPFASVSEGRSFAISATSASARPASPARANASATIHFHMHGRIDRQCSLGVSACAGRVTHRGLVNCQQGERLSSGFVRVICFESGSGALKQSARFLHAPAVCFRLRCQQVRNRRGFGAFGRKNRKFALHGRWIVLHESQGIKHDGESSERPVFAHCLDRWWPWLHRIAPGQYRLPARATRQCSRQD